MNETIRSLKNRKSVRVFTDKPIEDDKKREILRCALEAPTAGNMTLYSIIDVTDQSLKDALAVSCDNQPFIAKASMVLVFCADYHRWTQCFKRYCDTVRAASVGDLSLATADAIIAAQNSVVAAESLGIGSCYIGDITEKFEYHRELFNLPCHVVPVCMVVFGYPAPQAVDRAKPARFEIADIVFENGYDDSKALSMDSMLKKRQGLSDEEFRNWIVKFCERKYNSEFSVEMSRSCAESIKAFCNEQ